MPLLVRHRPLALLGAAVLLGAAAPAWAQPTGWVTAAGHAAVEEGRLSDVLSVGRSLLAGGGLHLLQLGPALLGVEGEGSVGRATASFGTVDDKVTVYRVRLGVRATWWWEHDEPRFVPYVRVGGVYRRDRGDIVRDDGFGWYAGAGLDFRINDTWSIGPFATYEAVSLSVTTSTFLVGLGLTFSY